jgi:hypothetical protein
VLAGEQQGHVDRNAGEDSFFNGRQSLSGARDLDHQVGTAGPREEIFGGGDRPG